MRIPGWLFIIGVLLFVGLTALLSALSFTIARQVAIDAAETGLDVGSFGSFLRDQPTPIPTAVAAAATPLPTASPLPGTTPVPQQLAPTLDPLADYTWRDPRRFTMLLLGIDQRSAVDEPGPFRTDTMIVLSVDPVRKTAGLLSIPRDLWVSIPGFQQGRINIANQVGDAQAYPGGGAALAMATVRQNLGIPVEKFLLVNFDVFTAVTNTVAPDGVEICVPELIDDPNYPDAGYGTIHLRFEPGCQRMGAEHLLQYARTRATFGGDFDRARRQQEVLDALRGEVLSAGGVRNFIFEAPTLWDQLTGSFKTNLTLDELLSLGVLMQDINRENIRFSVIDNLYVDLAQTTSGDQVLVPKHNSISFLIQQTFNPPEQDLTIGDLRLRSEAEEATIAVLNNTEIGGLAGQTRDWLLGRGVNVDDVGNTPPEYPNDDTLIRDYSDNPWTARYLAALMGLPPERIQPGADGLRTEGIVVIIGPDIQSLLAGQ